MVRLGINVPDKLLERLKPFKGSINISQVCRDALESQVSAYERANHELEKDGLDEVVQRFRKDLALREVDWEALGHQDARVWVELASLDDLETVFYRLSFVGRPGMLQRPTIDVVPIVTGAKRFDDRWQENEQKNLRLYDRDEKTSHYEKAKDQYEMAWFSYARSVWNKVQARTSEDKKSVNVVASHEREGDDGHEQ